MTSLKTFGGGLHPPELKSTAANSIVRLPEPTKVVLHLSQHIGAPSKASVNVGDTVEKYQQIAEPGGFVSSALHSTISGKVVAVGKFLHPLGIPSPAIVIDAATAGGGKKTFEKKDPAVLDADELKMLVHKAGIVGLGGATFPTHVKLSPPATKPIDTVILNGVECEPALTADHRLMLEQSDSIIEGLKLIMKILGASKGFIGIESNKPDAIDLLKKATASINNIDVVPLEVKYPQGGEKQLIFAIAGKEVPSGGLPMDVGVVVQNVATAAAIYDAIYFGKPLVERVVTLSGRCVKNPGNYQVAIGTLVSHFIGMAGGLKDDLAPAKVIMGGPMMGTALFDLNVPITKGTSGILVWDKGQAEVFQEAQCIRCGRCVNGCPMNLLPQALKALIDAKKWDQADSLGVLDCMECGCCSFTCPSYLPLVQSLKLGKKMALNERKLKSEKEALNASKKQQGINGNEQS